MTGPSVPDHQRKTHEATDLALIALDGLIAAIDLAKDQIQFTNQGSAAVKALHATLDLAQERMAEVWELRRAEWVSLGGK
ncbi:MAG: hypothetical protein JJU15_00470 [Pararhodobacter sp.]|nr:hypothetical protein [Pararhodobacter sp.]